MRNRGLIVHGAAPVARGSGVEYVDCLGRKPATVLLPRFESQDVRTRAAGDLNADELWGNAAGGIDGGSP